MTDIVKLYNPANSAALTQEQILNLQSLKPEQIKELAKAYPNMTMQRAYLLIVDGRKPAEKQLPQLSTFENLWNLNNKNGQKYWVAYGFRGAVKQKMKAPVARVRRTEVLDLSDQELLVLPGFKTKDTEHKGQEVKVTKVKTRNSVQGAKDAIGSIK